MPEKEAENDNEELLAGVHDEDRSYLKTFLVFVTFHLLYLCLPAAVIVVPFLLIIFAASTLRYAALVFVVAYWGHVFTSTIHDNYGYPWKAFENTYLCRFILEWLPVRILRTKKLDDTQQYVFACHPHGTLAFNRAAVGFSTKTLWDVAFPGIKFRVLTASAAFFVPVIRELWLWTYCVSASKKTAVKVMRELKASVFVYPGGEKEQIQSVFQKHRVLLSGRKGFVKLALEEGAHLVPVYAFGESHLYYHSTFALEFRKMLVSKFGVAIPLLRGQYGLMPYHTPITLVFGAPIHITKIEKPTQEDIDSTHTKYCSALRELFNTHKGRLGYANEELEIL